MEKSTRYNFKPNEIKEIITRKQIISFFFNIFPFLVFSLFPKNKFSDDLAT